MKNLYVLLIALLFSFSGYATVAPITGVSNLCVGTTITLSDATTGGTWSCASIMASVDPSTGIVTGTTAGTAAITYTVGTESVSAVVTVTPFPYGISGSYYGIYQYCAGNVTNLYTGVAGGTWSSSNTAVGSVSGSGATCSFTPISEGTTTITYSLSSSCSVTQTLTVLPTPAAITGATTVCAGATTTLGSATAGGSWSDGNWGAYVTIGTASGIVTGVAPGTTTVVYRGPSGCITTTTMTVTSGTAPITGISQLCTGLSTALHNISPSGTWSSSASAIASVNPATGVATGISPGTATISYSLGSCGTYATAVVTVTGTVPAITGGSFVCHWAVDTLSNAMGGGAWSSSNVSVATVDAATGVVSGGTAGVATITYNAGTCGIATKNVTVEVTIPYISGTTAVCPSGAATLYNSLPGGTWSSSVTTVAIVNSVTGAVTATGSGGTTISYTMPSGCSTTIGFSVYAAPRILPGCNNVGIGDTIKYPHPLYSIWSSSNTGVASVNSTGRVTGVTAGTAIITNYSPYSGCVDGLRTVSVTSSPLVKPITGYDIICQGATTPLTSAVPGGTWSSSAAGVATVSPTGVMTGVSGGQAVVTYSNTAGTAYCTHDVYINVLPAPMTGPTGMCAGQNITLNSTYTYGIWGAANTNYTHSVECNPMPYDYASGYGPFGVSICDGIAYGNYYTSSNTAIANPGSYNTSGLIQGVSAGTATITFTNGASHCAVTQAVTVNPLSTAAITGTAVLCIGGTTTLTDATTGGTWSSGNPVVAVISATTGVVTGLAAGTAKITYAVPGACGTATIVITISPAPAAITGNPGHMCTGLTATLANAAAGGTWSSSNSSVAAISSGGVVTAGSTGVAVLSYILGPCGNYATTTVSVSATPTITGFVNMCAGTSVALSVPGITGTWSSSNVTVAGVGATGSVTGYSAGTAAISFTSAVCGTATITGTVYAATPITGPAAVCVGVSTIFGSPDGGGTWSVSYTNATIDGAGTVTAASAGYNTITYSLPTGCVVTKGITLAAGPTPYVVTGGGTYCAGGPGVPVGLNTSYGGVTYRLYRAATAVGSPVSGTYGSISFGLQTLAGTYSVIATNASTGCTATMAGSATVAIAATTPAITGNPYLCSGGYTALSNTVGGGTWSSSASSVASVNTYGGVYGVATGTATISYTSACGVVTMVVTVGPAVAPITGTLTVCQGNTTLLSDATTGGTWSSSNASVATIGSATGLVYGGYAGGTIITYTTATGCISLAVVTVNSTPSLLAPSSVCVGATVAVSSPWAGGTWSCSPPAISFSFSTGIFLASSLGTSTISYVLPTGCMATKVVSVTTACSGTPSGGTASSDLSSVCPGNPAHIAIAGYSAGCGISYQWQSSPDGSAWTDVTGATETTYTDYPSVTTYYRCAVTCALSAATGYSSSASVAASNSIATHSIVPPADTGCATAHFNIMSCGYGSGLSVVTYFGDGTSASQPYSGMSGDIYHVYSLPGTYTVKHVLASGSTSQDSVIFTYEHTYCNTLPIKFYQDFNSNCLFDAGDNYNLTPVTVAIDSNGIPIDTINVISGLYRKTYGAPGTVYAFRVLSVSGGRVVACPSTAVIYDTISATTSTYPVKYFGLSCGTSTAFDLAETVSLAAGTTLASGNIYISNSYCTPASPVVTMHMSPKYHFFSSVPAPASVVGNTITWNLPPVSSAGVSVRSISFYMAPSMTLTIGDTVNSDYQVTPLMGDVNTVNNFVAMVNTITASCDPNNIAVTPAGNILPCQQLQYTIHFENTGNDVARNIYVLDTLPSGVDPLSLNAVMSSATMNVSVINDGVRNIARFDFPGINLLDSSHHNQCDGMLVFNIKAKNPLADGTLINDRAGIYFDDNAVVMTNTVTNKVGMDTIAGPGSVCAGAAITLSNATTGGTWSSSGAAATVSGGSVTGVAAGAVSVSYTVSNGCTSRTAIKIITVNATPMPGPVSGPASVCSGSTVTVTNALPGGTWTSGAPGVAMVSSSGIVTGAAAGTAVITYSVTNVCGTAFATRAETVNVFPAAGSITGATTVCEGASTLLGGTIAGGSWSISSGGIHAGIAGSGLVTGISAGTTTVYYYFTNSCGTNGSYATVTVNPLPVAATVAGAATVCVAATTLLSPGTTGGTWSSAGVAIATVSSGGLVSGVSAGSTAISYTITNSCGNTVTVKSITVNPMPAAATITGATAVCEGSMATLGASAGGGGWTSGSGSAAVSPGGVVSGVSAGVATISYTLSNACGATVTSHTMTVNPVVIPAVSIATSTGSSTVCSGGSTGFTAMPVNGGSGPAYQWRVNGIATGSGATYSYSPASGDVVSVLLNSNADCAAPDTAGSTISLTVLASAMPSVSLDATPAGSICVGAEVTFNATPASGGAAPVYSWLVNGVLSGSGSSYAYAPANGDIVRCDMISNYQCRLADTVSGIHSAMSVDSVYLPVATITASPGLTIAPGQSDTLVALELNGGPDPHYQWMINGVVIAGATTNTYISSDLHNSDSVCCIVTGSGPCGIATTQCVLIGISTGIAPAPEVYEMTIAPNPSEGNLVIKGTAAPADREALLEITDVPGQIVYSGKVQLVDGRFNEQLELSNTLSNGMYVLHIHTPSVSKVIHFVLKR